jgi:hypothetical protein
MRWEETKEKRSEIFKKIRYCKSSALFSAGSIVVP